MTELVVYDPLFDGLFHPFIRGSLKKKLGATENFGLRRDRPYESSIASSIDTALTARTPTAMSMKKGRCYRFQGRYDDGEGRLFPSSRVCIGADKT